MARVRKNKQKGPAAIEALLKAVKARTRDAEQAIDRTLAHCDESNARMALLDEWMRERGYDRVELLNDFLSDRDTRPADGRDLGL